MTRLVNLTPHVVVLRDAQGVDHHLPSEGVARVTSFRPTEPEHLDGVPVPVFDRAVSGPVSGLPEPQDGVLFVVSGMVLAAAPDREDLVAPGTGPADGPVRTAGEMPKALAEHFGTVEALLRSLLADSQLQELPLQAWVEARVILDGLSAARAAATPAGGQIAAVTRLVR